jgi:EAL domain-containing protein (putative c-di-GMP-specific phosphodiesterase class I)
MWLEYQPQVNLSNQQVLVVEAFLRWRHETSEFIRIAEETGLIIPIGEWVMEEVFAQANQWRDAGVKPFKIAINLSSKQVRKSGFVDFVSLLIEEYDFTPESIELEIAEHVFIDHEREVQKVLGKLKDLGFSLAIDDFGTGYSALGHIHRFPVDTIKIDQTFVANLQSDRNNKAIAGAIVAMAEQRNLRTVAECVEKTEQVQILNELQCQAAQGYFFARPLPHDKLAQWVGKKAA